MRSTFRTKLLASHVGLVAVVVLIAIVALNRSLGADLRGQLDQRLEEQAHGAAQWVTAGRHPERLAGRLAVVVGARVTIFDRNGAVLGDSLTQSDPVAAGDDSGPPIEGPRGSAFAIASADVGRLAASARQNQPLDPEVAAAQSGRVGHATRVDPAAGETHFVAVRAGDDLVLRLSAPLSGIDATLRAMRARLIFASALAAGAALVLGLFASRIAARPLRAMAASAGRIAEGDYDIRPASTSPDEFGKLAEALASLGAQLKGRIGDLTAERDRLSAILAGMVEGVLVTDSHGEVIVANPAAREILDHGSAARSPGDGKPIRSVPLPSLRTLIARAAETGETHEAEIEPAESGGLWLSTYVRPLSASAGGGVVAVLRDMTEIRRFETMRRDFVANVSHELRTPVTAIQGYAETLLSGSADADKTRQFLEIIHRQTHRLARLIEDLLRLSAIEARRDPPAREPVPLGALVHHVAQTVRARSEASRITVAVEVEAAAIALGDPGDLEEVIENLVDNALKYGRAGGTVRIAGARAGSRVRLQIIDDGPGIAAEHLARIFERFYRIDPARSRDRGGTGLGLSIVKHLTESMGGTVTVESEIGKGCRFTVDLPAAE